MRSIDGDALKDRLQEALEFQEKHDYYEGAELFEIAQDNVDEQPTIDAIPVEWLREFDLYYAGISGGTPYMNELIEAWQKEQEAR